MGIEGSTWDGRLISDHQLGAGEGLGKVFGIKPVVGEYSKSDE